MKLNGSTLLCQTNFSAFDERSGSAFNQPTCKLGTDKIATRRPCVEENRDFSFSTDRRLFSCPDSGVEAYSEKGR